jgi:hypothetical protein
MGQRLRRRATCAFDEIMNNRHDMYGTYHCGKETKIPEVTYNQKQ